MTFLEREDWKGFVNRYMPVPSVSHGFVEGWAAQAAAAGWDLERDSELLAEVLNSVYVV